MAAAVDDICLGHPVNAEVNRGGAVAIEPDTAKRITKGIEETARILGLEKAQDCMVQPSTPIAAWRRASERVGWG